MWPILMLALIYLLDSTSLDVNSAVKDECFLLLEYMVLAEQRSPVAMEHLLYHIFTCLSVYYRFLFCH